MAHAKGAMQVATNAKAATATNALTALQDLSSY